jgi:hypothetical protein
MYCWEEYVLYNCWNSSGWMACICSQIVSRAFVELSLSWLFGSMVNGQLGEGHYHSPWGSKSINKDESNSIKSNIDVVILGWKWNFLNTSMLKLCDVILNLSKIKFITISFQYESRKIDGIMNEFHVLNWWIKSKFWGKIWPIRCSDHFLPLSWHHNLSVFVLLQI